MLIINNLQNDYTILKKRLYFFTKTIILFYRNDYSFCRNGYVFMVCFSIIWL